MTNPLPVHGIHNTNAIDISHGEMVFGVIALLLIILLISDLIEAAYSRLG